MAGHSAIINPDAAIYIHQAQVLSSGDWKNITSPSMTYLSPYPIFLAGTFWIVGDWIVAARAVSICFGTAALALIYPLARLFFDRGISLLVLLVYATAPLFVHNGVIATKDSGAWFFVTLGMFLFVRGLGSKTVWSFFAAGGVFILAAWMRIETLIFPACSVIYLLAFEKDRRGLRTAVLIAPVVLVGLLGLGTVFFLQRGEELWARLGEIGPRIELSVYGYRNVRDGLRALEANPPHGIRPEYFDQIRSITWLTGFAVVVRNLVEAYHIPFFALFLAGLWTMLRGYKRDIRAAYFVLILVVSLAFFYFQIFSYWILEQRWIGAAIIASFFFIGQGLLVLRSFLDRYTPFAGGRSLPVLAGVLMAASLPKTVPRHDVDKKVFVQIGEKMAAADPISGPILILAPDGIVRWLSLYANRQSRTAPNPDEFRYTRGSGRALGSDYGHFVDNLRRNQIRYLIWAERQWPKGAFDLLASRRASDLSVEGEWFHRDTGKLVLFTVSR